MPKSKGPTHTKPVREPDPATGIRIEQRRNGPRLYARVYLKGRLRQINTQETTPEAAFRVALKWYARMVSQLELGIDPGHGTLRPEPLPLHIAAAASNTTKPFFAAAYTSFMVYCEAQNEPSEGQRQNYKDKWAAFQKMPACHALTLDAIDLKWLEDFRNVRSKMTTNRGQPVSNATLKKDILFFRRILRHAKERMGTLRELPPMPGFTGRQWTVPKKQRAFFAKDEWQALRNRAKLRADMTHQLKRGKGGAVINWKVPPEVQRKRRELYAFILVLVGGALRPEEALSLKWSNCVEGVVDDKDRTPCVRLFVYGKHATTKQGREFGALLYDGVTGFSYLKKLYSDAKPNHPLFRDHDHSQGFESLMKGDGDDENLRTVALPDGRVENRSLKSLRSTAISLRLDLNPSASYRDIAKWARTKASHIEDFYDQTHPEQVMSRVVGIVHPVKRPKNRKEAKRMKDSARLMKAIRKTVKDIPAPSGDEVW